MRKSRHDWFVEQARIAKTYGPVLEEMKRVNGFVRRPRRILESDDAGDGGFQAPDVKEADGPVGKTVGELHEAIRRLVASFGDANSLDVLKKVVLIPVVEMAGGAGGQRTFPLNSGELVDGKFVYTYGPAQPMEQAAPVPFAFLFGSTKTDCDKAGVDCKSIEYLIQSEGQMFKVGGLRGLKFAAPDGGIGMIAVEMKLQPDDLAEKPAIQSRSYASNDISSAKGLLAAIESLKKESRRDVLNMKLSCVDGDGNVYSLVPSGGSGRSMVFWVQKMPRDSNPEDPEFWTVGAIEEWIKKQNRPDALLFLKGAKETFGVESMEFEAGKQPQLVIGPWSEVAESIAYNEPTGIKYAVRNWSPSMKDRLFEDIEDAFEDSGFEVVDGADGDYDAEFRVDCDWTQDGDDNLGWKFNGYDGADPDSLRDRLGELGIEIVIDPSKFDPDASGYVRTKFPLVVKDRRRLDSVYGAEKPRGPEAKRQIDSWADACRNDLLDWN